MTVNYGELRKGMAIEMDDALTSSSSTSSARCSSAPLPCASSSANSQPVGRSSAHSPDTMWTSSSPMWSVARRSTSTRTTASTTSWIPTPTTNFPYPPTRFPTACSFLVEQIEVDLVLYRENPVAIELPITVNLEVTETVPGVRGDTAQGGTKPATLQTGLVVQVPLFINQGELVKVDTRSGQYLSRA